MGKADTTGSCKGFCGGQSADGCYCDDDCTNYGDCCSDKASVCDGQVPSSCDPMDAGGVGMCEMFMGYKWNGTSCVGLSGCSCAGADCGKLVLDKASCEQAHEQCLPPPPPPTCSSLDEQQCNDRSDCEWKTYPGFPGDISMCVEKVKTCYVGGCSSEVCSEIPDVVTPCVYPPIGGLPPAGSVCTLKADGSCGWVVP
jgi:hypothetical protein